MSPLAWDLGHIAAYEDLWLVHRAGGRELLRPDLLEVYDAFETPRAERDEHLNYLRREDALAYERAVRQRSLAVLGELDSDSTDPPPPAGRGGAGWAPGGRGGQGRPAIPRRRLRLRQRAPAPRRRRRRLRHRPLP